ncbi:MAG: hypothetical protein ACREIC_05900, partial [Limisphaerales bacterium]
AAALTGSYFPALNMLIDKIAATPDHKQELVDSFLDRVPLNLWPLVLMLTSQDPDLPPVRKLACEELLKLIPAGQRPPLLPFTVGGQPHLNRLEQHLFDLHVQDPAKARPLVAALGELSPGRPENWLLFGLTDCSEPPPRTEAERAWYLAGRLFRWGDNVQTADTPFDAEVLKQNSEAIRLLLQSPQLVHARELVGEYLIRQLAETGLSALLLEVLPPELFRAYEPLLSSIVELEARELADRKKLEEVRALLERFPFLKTRSALSLALRRTGNFDQALAEAPLGSAGAAVEKALCVARIANALDLELPEEPGQQQQLLDRLDPFQDFIEEPDPEIRYCGVLYALLSNDREEAGACFGNLDNLAIEPSKRMAYQLLLALQAQEPNLMDEVLGGLESSEAEEMLAFIPSNLLRAAIRALALVSRPESIKAFAQLLYEHLPETLDPLLGNEELLNANPCLLQRLLDKNDLIADPIQRWAGYQRVIGSASDLRQLDMVARAIDGCLSLKDPLLAPHQIRLLAQRIPQTEDLDLRELLIERLAELSADEAKPFLYQLLHTYLGNQRPADAWRIVEALRAVGECSEDLDQCSRALQGGANGLVPTKTDRLPRPVVVGFFGGDTSQKARTDQLRVELMKNHPGLTVEFDHTVWNANNLASLVQRVAKFDVVVASNLMRTDISRGIRQRARELNKTWGYCRNQGLATITNSILNAVNLHFTPKNRTDKQA